MQKKLFVGGLSWNTSDDELNAAFAAFGQVLEAKVVTDRDTGRSRGFGFVTFGEADEAKRAIESLDGSKLDGRTITVNEAREREGRSAGGGGGRRDNNDRGGYDRDRY